MGRPPERRTPLCFYSTKSGRSRGRAQRCLNRAQRKIQTINSGGTEDTTTAPLRRNTKQTRGRNTATATPGTVFEVQTRQRASTAESRTARRGRAPGSCKAHEWVPRPRRSGARRGARVKAGQPGLQPAGARGLSPAGDRSQLPVCAYGRRLQPSTYKGSPARPTRRGSGCPAAVRSGCRPPTPREARGRGRAGATWKPSAPDPPRQRRMEEPEARTGGGAGPALGSARPGGRDDGRGPPTPRAPGLGGRTGRAGPPPGAGERRPRRGDGDGDGGRGKGRGGGRPGAALTFSVSRSLTVGSGVRVDILWAAAAAPRPAR